MNNNILRTAKVKSNAQITQACEHNFRLRPQHNIDASRSHLNQVLVNTLSVDLTNASDMQQKLKEHYASLGIKPRSDSVLMMEFVVSASPDFFLGKTPDKVKEWAKEQTDFFSQKFGEQLKMGVLHLDERTPHIHFLVSTEMKSVKKYRNQAGAFFKEAWSLNAKRYDRKFLIDLHTEHASHNKKFGLKRGVRGSMRKHTDLKEFYRMVNKAMNADYQKQIEQTINGLETGLLSGKVSIEEVKQKFAPMVNNVLKQNKALREKFVMDIKAWAEKLSQKEDELNKKEAELLAVEEDLKTRRGVYKDAINRAANDAKIIDEQQSEIEVLTAELQKISANLEAANEANASKTGTKASASYPKLTPHTKK